MGYPMARNLTKSGNEVALWSHTTSKTKELAKEGKATACVTPKEVAERADYIFYCVGDSAMAKQITLGAGGLIEGVRRGAAALVWLVGLRRPLFFEMFLHISMLLKR